MAVSRPTSPDRLFKALADPTRLRILHLLLKGELCVCDLVRVLKSPQPKVSRHLAYLRKAGLVLARKEGLWMHYQLAPAGTPFHQSLLMSLHCCSGPMPELARDLEALVARPCVAAQGDACCA